MEEFVSNYLLSFDEINAMTATSYQLADSSDKQEKAKQIADDLLSFLIEAYTLGIQSASSMLNYELEIDLNLMYKSIFTVIDGKTFEDRVLDHVVNNDLGRLQSLAESEFHRVYNNAVEDGGNEYIDSGKSGVVKTWQTMNDDKVRETHVYLEGQTVQLNEHFYTFDGDHGAYPGGFTRVENNINCRCIIVLRPDN